MKKSGLERGDVVKVYYMLPAEPVVGKGGYRLIVADEEYVRFARKMVIASVVALLAGVAAVVYSGLRR